MISKITEDYINTVLSKEIIIFSQSDNTRDECKITFIPIHNEFRIYTKDKLKFITFSPDTTVDCYENKAITEYTSPKEIMKCKNDEKNMDALIKSIIKSRGKQYIVVKVTNDELIVTSVYQRLPNTDEFCYLFRYNKNLTEDSVDMIAYGHK
jgi:hypothetical protein